MPPSELRQLVAAFGGDEDLQQFLESTRLRFGAWRYEQRKPTARKLAGIVGEAGAHYQALYDGDRNAQKELDELGRSYPAIFTAIASLRFRFPCDREFISSLRDLRSQLSKRFGDANWILEACLGVSALARQNEIPRELVAQVVTRLRAAGASPGQQAKVIQHLAGIDFAAARSWVSQFFVCARTPEDAAHAQHLPHPTEAEEVLASFESISRQATK